MKINYSRSLEFASGAAPPDNWREGAGIKHWPLRGEGGARGVFAPGWDRKIFSDPGAHSKAGSDRDDLQARAPRSVMQVQRDRRVCAWSHYACGEAI